MSNNKFSRIVFAVLLILTVSSSIVAFQTYQKNVQRQYLINDLNTRNDQLNDIISRQNVRISDLESRINDLNLNLTGTMDQLRQMEEARAKAEKEIENLTKVSSTHYSVIAVDPQNKGYVIPLDVVIKSGNGSLFLNVANVLVDEELQLSAQTAVMVAREISRAELYNKDVFINIRAPEVAQTLEIGGGSGGAAITLTVTAAITGRALRNDVLITGTIQESHIIGRIGAVRAKALAAEAAGAVLFLVPEGQKSEVGNVGIQIKEVRTIEDAIQFAMT